MKRSRVLIVFGIINLVYALGWAFNGLGALMMLALSPEFYQNNNPMGVDLDPILATYAALESPVFKAYWVANALFAVVAGGVLAAGGVGLLMARPWGRKLSQYWAVAAILAVAVSVGMAHGYMSPALASQMNEPVPSGGAAVVPLLFALGVRWAYPVLLMVLLPRPNINEAFEHARQRRAAAQVGQPTPVYANAAAPDAPYAAAAPTPVQPPIADPPVGAAPPSPNQASPPPSASSAQQTWRDDPWNDPNAT